MQPKISIISPVYNVAPYLAECINSIRQQSFSDWEAIFVDDGSTDGSLKILELAAKEDSRIRYFTKSNEGPNSARQVGLANCSGDFVTFLDADDLLPKNALEQMYLKALALDLDIVVGQQFVATEDTTTVVADNRPQYPIERRYLGIFSWQDTDYDTLFTSIWFMVFGNKLYKKHLWDGIKFPPKMKMAEDQIVVKEATMRAKRISAIPEFVYIYRKRPGSATTTRSSHAFDVFQSAEHMFELFKRFDAFEKYQLALYRYFYFLFIVHLRDFLSYSSWPKFIFQMHKTISGWDLTPAKQSDTQYPEIRGILKFKEKGRINCFYLLAFECLRKVREQARRYPFFSNKFTIWIYRIVFRPVLRSLFR
ncbi:MAG: hypothetical protein RJB66_1687 [Pseudomonadota bacterium]|jgi:glycosyltransferase involved in cell wall biosynthesis